MCISTFHVSSADVTDSWPAGIFSGRNQVQHWGNVTLKRFEEGFSMSFSIVDICFFSWSLTTLSPLDFHEIPSTHFAFDGRGGGTPGSWIWLTWAFERFTSKRITNYVQLYTKDIAELMYTTTGFIRNDFMKKWWKSSWWLALVLWTILSSTLCLQHLRAHLPCRTPSMTSWSPVLQLQNRKCQRCLLHACFKIPTRTATTNPTGALPVVLQGWKFAPQTSCLKPGIGEPGLTCKEAVMIRMVLYQIMVNKSNHMYEYQRIWIRYKYICICKSITV